MQYNPVHIRAGFVVVNCDSEKDQRRTAMVDKNKVYVHLADGFEEIEALTTVDLLRRVGVDVQTVKIGGNDDLMVRGTHDIWVQADVLFAEADYKSCNMIVLPGGLPGTTNLGDHEALMKQVNEFAKDGKYVAAICAAPMLLGREGLLEGKRATIYPGMEGELKGAEYHNDVTAKDGNIITGRGPAAAMEFALKIIATLCGDEKSREIAEDLTLI